MTQPTTIFRTEAINLMADAAGCSTSNGASATRAVLHTELANASLEEITELYAMPGVKVVADPRP